MEGLLGLQMFEITSGVGGLLITIIGFFLKKLYERFQNIQNEIKGLEKEIHEHKLHDAKLYVEKGEITSIKAELKHMSGQIQNKLQSIEEHLRLHYDRRSEH